MVTLPLVPQPVARPIGERRMVFRDLDWSRYQTIRQAIGNHRNLRFIYDQGLLEVTMPLEDHEFSVRMIALFIRILVVELGMNLKTMGSTTLDAEPMDRSAESDNAYYIQNCQQVAGRNVNLDEDPPPDLVVEVDITHTDIKKLRFYASMGIPEFWRYNGEEWRIYQLDGKQYSEVAASPTFPQVPKEKLYEFLSQARQNEVEAELVLRQWIAAQ